MQANMLAPVGLMTGHRYYLHCTCLSLDFSRSLRFQTWHLTWESTARTIIAKHCKFVVKPKSVTGIRDVIRLATAGQVSEGIVAVFAIGKEMGEHAARPKISKFTPTDEQWETMVRGVAQARADVLQDHIAFSPNWWTHVFCLYSR
jgi:hypothetical protein